MARAGVNYVDVVKAAESVKANRLQPTVDRVRERLGTGSRSTIAPLLKRWRNESDSGEELTGGLPSDLLQLVKSLNERVHAAADLKVEEALKPFRDSNSALKRELQTVQEALKNQENVHKADSQRAQADAEKIERLELALSESVTRNTKFELLYQEAKSRVEELKGAVRELKDENRDIREHFEHYQTRTAEDRQYERDQYRSSNQHLQNQLDQFIVTHNRLTAQKEGLEKEVTATKDQLAKESEANRSLASEAQRLNARIDELLESIGALKIEKKDIFEQLQERQNELLLLTSQFMSLKKDHESGQATKNYLESTIVKLKTNIESLQDDLKILFQEKSSLEGQLRQIQVSLGES